MNPRLHRDASDDGRDVLVIMKKSSPLDLTNEVR
jgi:hypothetical protein